MASENEILVKVSGDVSEILSGLKEIQKAADKTAKETQKSFEGANKSLSSIFTTLGAGIAAIGASKAFGLVKDGLTSIVEAGLEVEKSQNAFRAALLASGDATEKTIQAFDELANSISNITGLDDDLIKNQIAYAKNLGLSNEQTEKAIQAAIDLSAATGKGLDQSMSAVSKSLLGYNRELAQISPLTKGFTDAQAKAGDAVDAVSKRFAGFAANFAQTLPGAIQRVNTLFGQFVETLGGIVVKNPAFVAVLTQISNLLIKFSKIAESNSEIIKEFVGDFIVGFANIFNVVQQFVVSFIIGLDLIITAVRAWADFVIMQFNNVGDVIFGVFEAIRTRSIQPLKDIGKNIEKNLGDAIKSSGEKFDNFVNRAGNLKQFSNAIDESVSGVKKLAKQIDDIPKAKEVDVKANLKIKAPDKEIIAEITGKVTNLVKELKNAGLTQLQAIEIDRNEKIATINQGFALKLIKTTEERNKLLQQVEEDATKKRQEALQKIYNESSKDLFTGVQNVLKSGGGAETSAAVGGLLNGLFSGIAQGAEGARKTVVAALTAAATAFLGPIGQALGPVFDLLSQGPEKVKAALEDFFRALPQIFSNIIKAIPVFIRTFIIEFQRAIPEIILAIIDSIPDLVFGIIQAIPDIINSLFFALAERLPEIITKLVELAPLLIEGIINLLPQLVEQLTTQLVAQTPRIITSLALQMPFVANAFIAQIPRITVATIAQMPTIAKGFIDALVKEVPRMVDEIVKQIKDKLGSALSSIGGIGGGGGGIFGAIGGVASSIGGAVSSVAKKFKFAEGGVGKIVPSGFLNDTFPASLTSGELVVSREDTDNLRSFLNQQEKSNGLEGLADQIISALGGGQSQNLTINLVIGEEQLANAILNLNQRGFRLS